MLDEDRPASLVPRTHFWIVAPTYPQLRQAWLELKEFMPKVFCQKWLEDDKIVYLKDGGMIEGKSADNPESLQTVGLDFGWITEAANIPDEVWYNQIAPMLRSPFRHGYAVAESRPRPVVLDYYYVKHLPPQTWSI